MFDEETSLDRCQKKLGYRFRNPELLRTALTHSTAAASPVDSNERMEFLGDAFLGMVVTETIYRRFPDYLEGSLSIIKGEIVSRRTCTRIAKELALEEHLILGKGFRQVPDSILANLIEALIAAVYLDGGTTKARAFVERLFADAVDEATGQPDHSNFKALLQSELHRLHLGEIAQYAVLDEQGPDHHKCFKIQVRIRGRAFQAAWANSKKEAEQKAAENALAELLGESPPWNDGN